MLKAATAPMTVSELAERLQVHPNTIRFHLEALLGSGQVERATPTERSTGRPPGLFRAVRGMDRAGPRQYRLLAEILVADLAARPGGRRRAIEAGRAWGRRHGADATAHMQEPAEGSALADRAVEPLVRLLDDIGFAPELREVDANVQIGLRHCPFLELAEARAEVVCPLHRGLMEGALEAWQSSATIDRLEPFVEPDLCLAYLSG
jgi:predicted ArsR family transcriptional regulator